MSSKTIQIVGGIVPQPDWNQTDETKADFVKNKPIIDQVFDPNSENAQSGKALEPVFADLKKGNIKEVVNANIWELEKGVYWAIGSVFYGTPKGSFFRNEIGIKDGGFLIVTENSEPHNPNSFITNYYTLIANGRIYQGTSFGEWVESLGTDTKEYVGEGAVYSLTIDENSTDKQIATAKAVFDYVNKVVNSIGGGSNIALVTEFEGTDVNYEENKVYNANVVNAILSGIAEILGGFASTEYVNELIGGIENGSY